MSGLTPNDDARVLVDYRTGDDAGVYLLQDGLALVQTVDFFTPVVDDPEAYGAIAAANALSDVYAMGGRPLTALSIAAIPEKDFPLEWAAAIFRGGAAKLREAGCVLLGGHTVRDPEIKFGYAVTGIVEPDQMMTNAAGQPGDVVVLTKPLGTGVIATALKAGQAPADAALAAQRSMATLNRIPSRVAHRHGVKAATDVTGFGLAGHASAVARESHVTIEIGLADLPLLPSARELSARFQPAGLKANRRQYEPLVADGAAADEALRALAYDPQTSGGLLLLVPPGAASALLADLPLARAIGRVVPSASHPLAFV
ncbi:MAG TPA: selenide, water dikinase SelD [Vicinamibacteria bacterium]|nr:selenide, water dikinase SelD [Vicinamibacteria bacterium]